MLFHPLGIFETRIDHANPFHRKFCGFMSLRGGCAVASAIWLGVNAYIATIAFMGSTPIFSFLNWPALIVFGSISIIFALVALWILYSLFVDTPRTLQAGVVFLMFIVPIYLMDIVANIFIFGVQKSQYMDWCLTSSEGKLNEIAVLTYNQAHTTVDPTDITTLYTYNCQKLWEDEVKFSIAIFIIMFILYIYWALCVFHYYEKLRELVPQPLPGGFMHFLNAPGRILPHYFFRNVPPAKS